MQEAWSIGIEHRDQKRRIREFFPPKLSHAQHLDEVTWTTKNWHGLQMQRLSVVLHTAVAWQTVNELACGESGIVHGHPVDTEFALDEQRRLVWLQARPVTTHLSLPPQLQTPADGMLVDGTEGIVKVLEHAGSNGPTCVAAAA
ncbi:hypothetical protein EMIHUDRAFT_248064 [Emiliania huxleyi CCMP1516]|uniref:Pyruvate phosphate dikinase AMP/ATP-binding domain-containing protein n=2 Tax=Emiliania huxleyi TaxID=2903 RepID=A0A0D3IIX9_EMIH1|nr:hypothetical protein EMIHUDRAFT_248064 [Emiliania huxleyi CCMP1516]EOD11214.1 hypothetical protein EMIHUDRAFT_248064 [Emiliania huxleyi CCMP1516]|eukprot:XP_005763643.1 hypothetical protein EMIHUDRAFT_248064 [Emiliania huxleyi CCMP1516]